MVIIELKSFKYKAVKEAITTEQGPVGPEIKSEPAFKRPPLIKHKIIAPHIPLAAPSPVATPNASACGNATILEIIPPKISFFIFLKYDYI